MQKNENIKDDSFLPKKDLFRIDEVAEYFSVTDRCIQLWIAHGHLEKDPTPGRTRISRESILRCRFGYMWKKGNDIF